MQRSGTYHWWHPLRKPGIYLKLFRQQFRSRGKGCHRDPIGVAYDANKERRQENEISEMKKRKMRERG
jgi:hypothetical protein